jgi:methyl-accepting chemotaxis protein
VNQAMDKIQEYTNQAVLGAKQSKDTANDLVLTANTLEDLVKGRD